MTLFFLRDIENEKPLISQEWELQLKELTAHHAGLNTEKINREKRLIPNLFYG
jgi:hypothetical protein